MPWNPNTAKNDLALNYFLTECPERVLDYDGKKPAVDNPGTPVCGVVGEQTGISVAIGPIKCAECRLHGQINPDYPRNLSLDVLVTKLHLAWRGFHRGQEHILDLADRALALKPEQAHQQQIHDAMFNCLSLGRIDHETHFHVLLRKHGYESGHEQYAKLTEAANHWRNMNTSGMAPQQPAACCAPQTATGIFEKAKAELKAVVKAGVAVVSGVVSEQASDEVIAKRKAICEACFARDTNGDLLYRTEKGVAWCGKPFYEQRVRNENRDGCGCALDVLKWKVAKEACPLGHWTAVEKENA